MWNRILEIMRKEFRQTLREPRMRGMLFGPPLIQLLVFGYAVNMDVDQARIAWMDQDRTPAAIELREAFTGSGRFKIVAAPASESAAQDLLDHGGVNAVVRVGPGFGRDLAMSRQASVQVLLDGTNSNTASIVAGYSQSVIARYSGQVQLQQQRMRMAQATAGTGAPVSAAVGTLVTRSRVWFNPDLRSRTYYVPGVIINIITLVTLMLTAMAVVREKEIGTMEQLMVTPIRPIELILGKTLPFSLVGIVELFLVTVAAMVIFGVPMRGNALLLLFSSCLFLLSTLGAGLFISTISNTQQQAMMASFFFFMPAFTLSGFSFPVRNMPYAVQILTIVNPLRHYMVIVRDIFLKGSGIAQLWPNMVALAVFGSAILWISASRFRKTLD
jgi:ABC-2 type transport system permease protein